MQTLLRIDQHAGDVATRAQHVQRFLGHFRKRIGLVRRQRIADARLHVAPPAVIGAAEAYQVAAPRVIAREPHRLHHRLGARHVERHLVEPGNLLDALGVLDDQRMVGAEHRAELVHARGTALDRALVEVVAEDVDAVGAGEIVEAVTVEIGDRHARGRLQEAAERQMRAHHAAILERHPVGAGELQVGNGFGRLGAAADRLGKARLVKLRQAEEAGAAQGCDVGGGAVAVEKPLLVEVVERHKAGEAARHAGMAGQRAVLGLGQFQPAAKRQHRGRQRRGAEPVKGQSGRGPLHRIGVYPERFTKP